VIINKTDWNTSDLTRLIRAVAKEENLSAAWVKRAHITIQTHHGGRALRGYAGGCAYIGGSVMWLKMPLPRYGVSVVDLARTIAHEFAHMQGQNHKQMSVRYGWRGTEQWRWAEKYPIRVKTPKAKVAVSKATQIEKKLLHAQKCLKRSEFRAKLLANSLRKWRRKVRYYERLSAALPRPPKVTEVPPDAKAGVPDGVPPAPSEPVV